MKLVDCLSTKAVALGFFYQISKEKKVLRDILRTYAAEKDKFNLDLRIYKKNWLDITVPFKKKNRRLDKWF